MTPAAFRAFLFRKGLGFTGAGDAEALYASGAAPAETVRALLSEYADLPAYRAERDGDASAPDTALLLYKKRPRDYLRGGFMPLSYGGGAVTFGVVDPLSAGAGYITDTAAPLKSRFVLMRPDELQALIETRFSAIASSKARELLKNKLPFYSAYGKGAGKRALLGAGAVCATALYIAGAEATFTAALAAGTAMFVIALLTKTVLFAVGFRLTAKEARQAPVARGDDGALPFYSVIVPLYREPEVIPSLIEALSALDYPPERLEIVFITEADDGLTAAGFAAAALPARMRVMRVPPSQPRTKPKACNYALSFLKGDIAVIYDAEDVPEPLQLRKAAAAFALCGKETVSLQASLNFYNARTNVLTRFFAAEYGAHFDGMLRGLQALDLPILLGGTSNHFRYDALARAGGWDPYNVTEDADLGIRIYARRKRAATLPSYTMEEAPENARAWINQRSRWIKGHMQTAIVHSSAAGATVKRIGLRRFAGMHLFMTLPVCCYLLAPALFIAGGASYGVCKFAGVMCMEKAGRAAAFTAYTVFPCACVAQWCISLAAVRRQGLKDMTTYLSVFLAPCYWVLHSVAAYKAFYQLIVKPYYWEKTAHGKNMRGKRKSFT